MALTTGELDRIKSELGYNLLEFAAQPYIGVAALFEQVIRPYLREGATTTSTTAVVAAPRGALVSLVLASATGVTAFSKLAVDVDDLFEYATVRSITGSTVSVYLKKAHSGTYPVTLDGGLQQIREALAALQAVREKMADPEIDETGALKKVDEVEFHDVNGKSWLQLLQDQQRHWRRELSSFLGVPQKTDLNMGGGGGVCALY